MGSGLSGAPLLAPTDAEDDDVRSLDGRDDDMREEHRFSHRWSMGADELRDSKRSPGSSPPPGTGAMLSPDNRRISGMSGGRRSRDFSRDRSRERSRDVSRDRSRERSRDVSRDRSRDRSREHSRDRSVSGRDPLTRFFVYGRPDLNQIISSTVYHASEFDTVAVGACGVPKMVDEVRAVVADKIRMRGPSISLFCEEFNW
jgi:hypothetical protein